MRNKFLKNPIKPFVVDGKNPSAYRILKKLSKISFQARQLGTALDVFEKMLREKVTIFLGLAGAMTPAGMREIISFLLKKNLVDCLVSTGANLFHDCLESLGYKHYKGSPNVDDVALRKARVDRIYDTFVDDLELEEADRYIINFAESLEDSRPYTTREFFYLFGKKLSRDAKDDGIITSAYKSKIPIYCPAIGDSSYGIALAMLKMTKKKEINFSIVGDVLETAMMAAHSSSVAELIIGGGTPKNFIQQTEVTAFMLGYKVKGLKYAIQLTQDSTQWGGLSGCTFDEAKSWGKVAFRAERSLVHVDATIGLPLLVSAIAERFKNKKRKPPLLVDISGQELKFNKGH